MTDPIQFLHTVTVDYAIVHPYDEIYRDHQTGAFYINRDVQLDYKTYNKQSALSGSTHAFACDCISTIDHTIFRYIIPQNGIPNTHLATLLPPTPFIIKVNKGSYAGQWYVYTQQHTLISYEQYSTVKDLLCSISWNDL